MPTEKNEYTMIGDGKDIQKPSKTFTINLPLIKIKIPKKKENKSDDKKRGT